MNPMQVVIHVEGGIVQDVFCDDPPVRIVVVDWDVEAPQPGDRGIVRVKQSCRTLNAYVGM